MKKRGIYMIDVCVGFVLAGVAMMILTQGIFMLVDHRTDSRTRQAAVDVLMNVNEMFDLAKPFPEQVEKLGPVVQRTLPDGKLAVEKLDQEPAPGVSLVKITVSYDDGKKRPKKHCSLLRAVAKTEDKP